jgi:hypothetical protein
VKEAIAFLYDPPKGWANPTDCVEFPCTAPSNVVIKFDRTYYEGKKPFFDPKFQIISDTESVSETLQNCEFVEAWNAWKCQNKYLSVLRFISLDGDMMDRTVSPIYVVNEQTGFNNKLNSMMDHVWDGFYTG